MIAYVDTSVILRLALRQPDAWREWRKVRQGIASAVIVPEAVRTLDRLSRRVGLADADFARHRNALFRLLSSLELVEINALVLERAAEPTPTHVGTLGALHLATALLARQTTHPDLIMATHDAALALAAEASGMRLASLHTL